MRRRLFTVFFLLPLFLSVVTAVLWGRSYYAWDSFSWDGMQGRVDRHSVGVASGKLVFDRVLGVQSTSQTGNTAVTYVVSFACGPGFHEEEPFTSFQAPSWAFAGFSFADSAFGGYRIIDMRIPLWVVLILFLPLLTLRMLVDGRRQGTCRACRYDLTGNTSGTCPECGTPIT